MLTEQVPELQRLADVEVRIVYNLDSSDIGPSEWTALANVIAEARPHYDGFVVIHGTDTMAYTASALSLALADLDWPVVLTGSQRPLGELRTDARRNLVDAVDLATRDIPEVGICFDGSLLRGNRSTKGDAWSYNAFASPACAPLARLGLDVEIAPHVRRLTGHFRCLSSFRPNVAFYRVIPGVDPRGLLGSRDDCRRRRRHRRARRGQRRCVGEAACTGHRAARRAGDPCADRHPGVGRRDRLFTLRKRDAAQRAGALSGGDLSVEAATTKMMHALAQFPGDVQRSRGISKQTFQGSATPR